MPLKTPSYRKHKSGQAVVRLTVDGRKRDFYLGPYGSERSKEKYQQVLAEYWQPSRLRRPAEWPNLEQLMEQYLRHCETKYAASNERDNIILAMRPLRRLFGEVDVCGFGPRMLKQVQAAMADDGLSRNGVNKRIGKRKRMFRWGVAEELVPPRVLTAIEQVDPLKRGQTKAPETQPVMPANDQDVSSAIEHMTPPVAAMVALQRLSGMRPSEVCNMRRCDIDTSGDAWTYSPASHKNAHRGKSRLVALGPKAQAILRRWMPAAFDAFVFSPRRHFNNRKFRDHYDQRQYRKSVYQACDKAGVPRFAPYQLRHSAGQQAREEFGGLEATSALLGNSVAAAAIYAERNAKLAREIAGRIG